MEPEKHRKNKLIMCLLWFFEGVLVGFGAILPGVSGGTLCVVFGMYRPIIEVLSSIKTGLKRHWLMLGVFALGIAAGFVGLSGIAAKLLEMNTALVTCAFVGFIIGTFPELWQDAGSQGRARGSVVTMLICFAVMIGVLTLLKTQSTVEISPDFWGFLLCGVLWGFSFIIPGLSSSSLLLFFGLYQPMLEGISTFDFGVLIPMGIGMLACVLLLSKVVGLAFKKRFSLISHGVLGIVAATAVMILPFGTGTADDWIMNVLFIAGGAVVSYFLGLICGDLKKKAENK